MLQPREPWHSTTLHTSHRRPLLESPPLQSIYQHHTQITFTDDPVSLITNYSHSDLDQRYPAFGACHLQSSRAFHPILIQLLARPRSMLHFVLTEDPGHDKDITLGADATGQVDTT